MRFATRHGRGNAALVFLPRGTRRKRGFACLGWVAGTVYLLASEPAQFAPLDADPLHLGRRPEMEARPLFDGKIERIWSTAESSIVAETNRAQAQTPWLRWRIVVDHFGGEPKYPIGWPRVWRSFQESDRDWSDWDYLEVVIRAETPRENLPSTPASLLIRPEGETSWSKPLTEVRKGNWGRFLIPLWALPKLSAINQLMFSLSDADYRHGDQVEFIIATLALTRYSAPTLLDFAAEQTALFADAPGLPVRFRLTGLKPAETVEVTTELRQAGRLVASQTLKAGRGRHHIMFEFGDRAPAAGEYEVSARIGTRPAQTGRVRLLASPWQERSAQP